MIIGGVTLLGGCSDICNNTVVDQNIAPGGEYRAVVFQRDCGATTGFSTQISISERNEKSPYGGVIFIADDEGISDNNKFRGPKAETEWISDDLLLVRFDASSRIFRQETHLSGLQIRYKKIR